MKKSSLIGLSAAAALSTMRSAFASPQAQPAIPVSGFRSKAKYSFLNMLHKISATKKYASRKLRTRKSGNVQTIDSGRGALGARKRAVGIHWVKALA